MSHESDIEWTNLQDHGNIVDDHRARCMICRRVIKTESSIRRRMGPICYKRQNSTPALPSLWNMDVPSPTAQDVPVVRDLKEAA